MSFHAAKKAFEPHPDGKADAGATPRPQPCALRTWCVFLRGHAGRCVEVVGPRGETQR